MKNFLLLMLLLCVIVASVAASDFSLAGMWKKTKTTNSDATGYAEFKPGNKLIFWTETSTGEKKDFNESKYKIEGSEKDSLFYIVFQVPLAKDTAKVSVRAKVKILGQDSLLLQPVETIFGSGEVMEMVTHGMILTRLRQK